MFTENGVMIDMDELHKVVDNCDVFTVGFRTFLQRLIVDTRKSADEGPMVEVVEAVGTVEERFFWLGKQRPAFGVPERFTFFIWPHSIRFFRECGLAERIRGRTSVAQFPDSDGAIVRAVAHLEQLETRSTLDAITGRAYHTLWERGG